MQDYGLLRHFIPRNNTAVRFRHYKALYRGLQGDSVFMRGENPYMQQQILSHLFALPLVI